METFVFVHGAMHGGWCWQKIVPLIEEAGHKAIALDLPGHGENKTMSPHDRTLADYVDYVVKALDRQPKPVILVAHSLGGITATQVAEYRPGKINTLVYLSAITLESGTSLLPETARPPDWLSLPDADLKDMFYGDCSESDFHWARDQLVPEPLDPFYAKINTTEANFGSVSKVYITCLKDKTIRPELQERMYRQIACRRVIPMDTSHSPFLSAPAQLADILLSLAE